MLSAEIVLADGRILRADDQTFVALCPAPEMLHAERQWIRALARDLEPHALGTGTYVNVMPESDVTAVRDAYGERFARLQAVKAAYDSGNFFHRNANIPPAAAASA